MVTLTATRETAQRLLNLVFIFNAAERPLRTSEILNDMDLGYGSANRESDVRKFRRDRATLAAQGIVIKEIRAVGTRQTEDSSWALDREQTFAAGGLINTNDAILLINAIDEYLATTNTPLAQPLHIIRQKAAETIGYETGELPEDIAQTDVDFPISNHTNTHNHVHSVTIERALWSAFSLQRAITFDYTNAVGSSSPHTVSIYGFLTREGTSYLIGFDEHHQEIRTFKIERVKQIQKLGAVYTIPKDFSSAAFMWLPFELGQDPCIELICSFPPERTEQELQTLVYNRGTLERTTHTWLWHITAHSLDEAVRFCLAHTRDGMRPVAPQTFVDAWRNQVRKVLAGHVC